VDSSTASKQLNEARRSLGAENKLGTCLAVIVFKRYSLFSQWNNNPHPRTVASAASDRAMLV